MMKGLIMVSVLLLFFACSGKPVYPEAASGGDYVKIELRNIEGVKPVFYTFYNNRKGINFFVVKVNGIVQSYFDACAKCYPKKAGYRIDSDRVGCRACDIRYSIYDLKDGIGSCYPIKLAGRMEGETYLIAKKELLKGDKYF